MRNLVSYPRVRAPRRAHKIIPALGGIAVCLLTGALLFPQFPVDIAETAAEAAPAGAASGIAPRTARSESDRIGLRGSLLADIGPYDQQGFAARSGRAKAYNLFVSRAPAETAVARMAADSRVADAPTPPARPAEIQSEKTAALAEPAPQAESAGAPTPPRRPVELSVALRPEPPKEPPAPAARMEPLAAPRQTAARTTVVPAAPPENRGFFERLFGGAPQAAAPQAASRPAREALAYAPATDAGGLFGGLRSAVAPANPAARYDRYTAVYDISAHVVYMPDGTRLEAHSGLREHLDDARYVHLRMRGATPPHLYNLTPREALFHGVEALRLNPVGGGGAIYGRAGLLAHTFMLGPNGDSNGCVSFRDYNAFLQAYKRGDVRRLAVVAHL